MRIKGEELRKKYFIDEEWQLIGYNSITEQPVYICSKDFLLIEKLKHFLDEYEIMEFENDEVTTPDFETFAVNWATGFLKSFVSLKDHEAKEKENLHDEILHFVKNGKYGEIKSFSISNQSYFWVLIVPGGYIYSDKSYDVFVPYEQVIKELAFKKESLPIQANNPQK